jgi:hypothetical protein
MMLGFLCCMALSREAAAEPQLLPCAPPDGPADAAVELAT